MESMSDEAAARVVMIDDDVLVVDGVGQLLDTFGIGEIVGRGTTVSELGELVLRFAPHIVIIDHDLPDADVVEVIECVRQRCSSARVVVLTDVPLANRVTEAMDGGAAGYLLRTQRREELAAALRVIMSGGYVLAPGVHEMLLSRSVGMDRHSLSPRERDVLQTVANMGTAAKAAGELALEPSTVRNHLQHAMTKLGVHSTVEAVVLALRERIIEMPDGRAS
jgi:DNA-binding NarL/FixJ family response regulator